MLVDDALDLKSNMNFKIIYNYVVFQYVYIHVTSTCHNLLFKLIMFCFRYITVFINILLNCPHLITLTPISVEGFSSFWTSTAFKPSLSPSTMVYTSRIRRSINTNSATPNASFKSFKFYVTLYDKLIILLMIIYRYHPNWNLDLDVSNNHWP